LGNTIVQLVADQQGAKAIFTGHGEPVLSQDFHPCLTASTIWIFHHVNGRTALRQSGDRAGRDQSGGTGKHLATGQHAVIFSAFLCIKNSLGSHSRNRQALQQTPGCSSLPLLAKKPVRADERARISHRRDTDNIPTFYRRGFWPHFNAAFRVTIWRITGIVP
jgi:hypothetical protein